MAIFFTPTPTYYRRTMQATHWHDGEAYHVAGWDGGAAMFSDTWRTLDGDPGGEWGRLYGPASGTNNVPTGDNIFPRRSYHLAQSFNGELHFPGGYSKDYTGKVIRDHWSIGDGGRKFSQWQPPPWEAREAYGLAASPTMMALAGGVTYLNPDPGYHLRAFADVWAFDLNGDWTLAISNAPWGKRRSPGFEYLGGYFWLWGGYDSQNNQKSDLWKWDGVNAPVQMPVPPWSARGSFFSCVANGRLWMMGGTTDQAGLVQNNEVWSCDPATGEWAQHANAGWSARFGCRALVEPGTPDTIYIIGGATGAGTSRVFHGDVWSTQDGDTWTRHNDSTLDVG